jgi:hypothetical protein
LLLAAPAEGSSPGLTRIITDTFSNTTSQHATAVEPDTFAFGGTFVATAQVGRSSRGASGLAFATSDNGGATWTRGLLPNITSVQRPSSRFQRVSDPSVAYDAKHGVWLISSVAIRLHTGPRGRGFKVPRVYVSRSTDGAETFGNPITVAKAASGSSFDKTWTACDNHPTSPFYGHCYTTFDDTKRHDRLKMSTSTNGGVSWGRAKSTADDATGLGGQPVVRPGGTVIVPASHAEFKIIAFRSQNGGRTWGKSVPVALSPSHFSPHLRSEPLPTAGVDAAGKVYVAWQDCRFRARCSSNDIVLSKSTTGRSWTAPKRIPIGTRTDHADHFVPGIAVMPGTARASARLALTYYSYRHAACRTKCALEVGYVQSGDGGHTWSAPITLAGPFEVNLIARTALGRMVGDYISTSWVGDRAYGAFAVGRKPTNGKAFDEGIFVPTGGLNRTGSTRISSGARAGKSAAASRRGRIGAPLLAGAEQAHLGKEARVPVILP